MALRAHGVDPLTATSTASRRCVDAIDANLKKRSEITLSHGPKATNANSPLCAHSAPVLRAVGVDSFRSFPRPASVTAFRATKPPASPNILRGCAANNEDVYAESYRDEEQA